MRDTYQAVHDRMPRATHDDHQIKGRGIRAKIAREDINEGDIVKLHRTERRDGGLRWQIGHPNDMRFSGY